MLSVTTAPHQAVVGSLAPILGCDSSNQPNLFHTFMFLPFLWASLRLCILPLSPAEVTDKGPALCTVTDGGMKNRLTVLLISKEQQVFQWKKEITSHAWQSLRTPEECCFPLATPLLFLRHGFSQGTARTFHGEVWCHAVANRARNSFRLRVSNLALLGNRVCRGRVKNVPDGCSPQTDCLTRRHQHSCW